MEQDDSRAKAVSMDLERWRVLAVWLDAMIVSLLVVSSV